jgi:hypothetical protein
MRKRTAEEILRVLEQQASEDAAVERDAKALAAMTDEELDAELRRRGMDPRELEKEAEAIYELARKRSSS